MGLLSSITSIFAIRDMRPAAAPEAGISNGEKPGDIGVWVVWDEVHRPTEVFRLVVKPFSRDHLPSVPQFSYTFAPAFDRSFLVSIESPFELREFLRGKNRAHVGHVVFEFWLADQKTASVTCDLESVQACYQGKGYEARPLAQKIPGSLLSDKAEVAKLKHGELKEFSEAAKRALEEKRRKEEEERQRIEAEKAAAAAKAAEAAKAAAAKAAAAKSAGGGTATASGGAAAGPAISGKVALIYGTTTGNTGNVAEAIKTELGSSITDVKLVTDLAPTDFTIPEVLILGVPTWHIGEMQDDWAVILPEVAKQDYKGKKIAIFGLGDGKGYPDTYVDAMQELWEKFEAKGAKLYGLWPTEGYEYGASKAIKDGKFLGLVIDIENQDNLSDDRIKRWCAQIRTELSI